MTNWQTVPEDRANERLEYDVRKLAKHMQARDARQYGVKTDDGWTPSWEDTGETGQAEYITDATAAVQALMALGWVPIEEKN